MDDNRIVIEYPKNSLINSLIVYLIFTILGFTLIVCVSVKEAPAFVYLGVFMVVVSLPMVIKNWYRLGDRLIAVIDCRGVFLEKQKELIPWKAIRSISCEVNVPKPMNKKRSDDFFYCLLKDSRTIEVKIEDANYSVENLYDEIVEKFPEVRCRFVDRAEEDSSEYDEVPQDDEADDLKLNTNDKTQEDSLNLSEDSSLQEEVNLELGSSIVAQEDTPDSHPCEVGQDNLEEKNSDTTSEDNPYNFPSSGLVGDSEGENKIVVEHPISLLIVVASIYLLFWGLSAFLLFKGGNVKASTVLLCVLVIAYTSYKLIRIIPKLFHHIIVVIDNNGVYMGKQKRLVPLEEINFLSVDVEESDLFGQTQKRNKLWCYLKDGEELEADFSYSNFAPLKLHQRIKKDFPQIKCYPPEGYAEKQEVSTK